MAVGRDWTSKSVQLWAIHIHHCWTMNSWYSHKIERQRSWLYDVTNDGHVMLYAPLNDRFISLLWNVSNVQYSLQTKWIIATNEVNRSSWRCIEPFNSVLHYQDITKFYDFFIMIIRKIWKHGFCEKHPNKLWVRSLYWHCIKRLEITYGYFPFV